MIAGADPAVLGAAVTPNQPRSLTRDFAVQKP
jgi:hypothetical protein